MLDTDEVTIEEEDIIEDRYLKNIEEESMENLKHDEEIVQEYVDGLENDNYEQEEEDLTDYYLQNLNLINNYLLQDDLEFYRKYYG